MIHPATGGGKGRAAPVLLWAAAALGLFLGPGDWWPALGRSVAGIPLEAAGGLLRIARQGLPDLALLVLFLLAALGAGRLLLRSLGPDGGGTGRLLPFQAAAGLGVLAYGTLLLGVLGGYTTLGRGMAWAALAALAAAGAARLLALRRDRPGAGLDPATAVGGAATAVAFLVVLGKAHRPAVFYDALTYHLGVPSYHVLEGGVGYIPWDSCSNFPFTAEMLYTLGLLLGDVKGAQMTSVLVYLLVAILAGVVGREAGGPRAGAAAAGLVATAPCLMESAVLFTNDLHLLLWGLAALATLILPGDAPPRGRLVLAGIFTGLALGTKYLALATVLPPALLLAWRAASPGAGRRAAAGRVLRWWALPTLLVASPWLVKNLVLTGNPFHPAFHGLLGGRDMDAATYRSILALAHRPSLPGFLEGIWRHPWRLLFQGPAGLPGRYGVGSMLGPAIPVLLPLLTGGGWRRARPWLAAAGVVYLLWGVSFTQLRYGYLWVAILTLAASLAAAVPRSRGGRWAVLAALSLVFLLNLGLGARMTSLWTGTTGLEGVDESDGEFLRRRGTSGGVVLDAIPLFLETDRLLPSGAVVLLVGEAQHLYLPRRHRYTYLSASTPYDIFRRPTDDGTAARALAADGVTHLVYSPRELRRLQAAGAVSFPAEANGRLETFLSGPQVRLLARSGTPDWPVLLYRLEAAGGDGG
jgi:hypothetical protein